MEKLIEQISGVMVGLDGIPAIERTAFLDIAKGRLETAVVHLKSHVGELARSKESKARIIAEKKAEVAKLEGATAKV